MLFSIQVIWLFALTFTGQLAQCMLGPDLKRANNILYHSHGIWLCKPDQNFNLKEFEFYTKLNLSNYRFSEKRLRNHLIKSWKSLGPEHVRIYEVHSSVSVDTVMFLNIDFK
jgi:hypothetical protein